MISVPIRHYGRTETTFEVGEEVEFTIEHDAATERVRTWGGHEIQIHPGIHIQVTGYVGEGEQALAAFDRAADEVRDALVALTESLPNERERS